MENLGQHKALLSERLAQQNKQVADEVAQLTATALETLKRDLTKHVSAEVSTTVAAIQREISGLPQQVRNTTEPLKEILEQAEGDAAALKLVSSVWLKALLIGMFTALGLMLGCWAGSSWLWSQIEQDMDKLTAIRQEISKAERTLDALPKGVEYIRSPDGSRYILARKIGKPYKTESGKMAVELK